MKCGVLTLCILVCTTSLASGASSKQQQTQEVVRIIDVLYQHAVRYKEKNYTANEFHDKFRQQVHDTVEETLANVQDPEVLVRLTLVAMTLYRPGNIKDAKFDEVFFQTYDVCIAKLAEHVCQANYDVLQDIQYYGRLDGGESLIVQEILRRFEQQLGKSE
jgi:hypothetical protein